MKENYRSYLRVGNLREQPVMEEPLGFYIPEATSDRQRFGLEYLTLTNEYISRLQSDFTRRIKIAVTVDDVIRPDISAWVAPESQSFLPDVIGDLRTEIGGRMLKALFTVIQSSGKQFKSVVWDQAPLDLGQPVLETDLDNGRNSLYDALIAGTVIITDETDLDRAYEMDLIRTVKPLKSAILDFMKNNNTIAILSEQTRNGLNSESGTQKLWTYYLGSDAF